MPSSSPPRGARRSAIRHTASDGTREAARVAALERYAVVDTPREATYDDLAQLAATICGAPMAAVTLVDARRQWFKAVAGAHATLLESGLARDATICAHTIEQAAPLVVRDASRDSRFRDLAIVTGPPHVRFYAGAPIVSPDGHAVGTICVLDVAPRSLSAEQVDALSALGRQAARALELREHVSLLEREIDERAAAEEALFEREHQLRLFVRHTPVSVAMFDRSLRYVVASDRWLSLTGLTREEAEERTLLDTYPDMPERWQETLERVLTGSVENADEDPWPQRDGSVTWLRWDCRPWHTAAGAIGGVVVFIENVTERRRAAEALAQSEARNRRLAEATLDGIVIVRDLRVVEVNRRFCELFGVEEAEAIGRLVTDFVPPEGRVDVIRHHHEGVEETYQSLGRRADGSVFPVEASARAYSWNGMPARLAVIRDVTERSEVDRLKNEFVSTVSHELRTPLTSIRGSLGLIEAGVAGEVSPRARELTRIARANADRLIRLINDILDLDKMESGRLEMRVAPLDPGDVVTTTLEELQAMADQRKVRLVAQLAHRERLLGDRDRVAQVLTNLVSNAIKFSPEDADVVVRSGTGAAPGTMRFTVEDRGPGIPADKVDRLFRRFAQLDASDSRARGGTGLGLAISRTIIEQLGGAIGVESSPGVLTQFWFELPLLDGERPSAAVPGEAPDGSPAPSPHRVLVVEDDLDLADVICILLAHEGFDVTHAPTLAEAARELDAHTPSAILLDVSLPDGDGLDFITGRRATHGLAAPVVVMSGHDAGERAEPPDVREWLVKPSEERALFAALRRAVRPPGPPRALVVDADAAARHVRAAQLGAWGIECAEAGDGEAALALVGRMAPDLLVLDPALPALDGFALVARLRQGPARAMPVLVHASRELSPAERKALALGPTAHLVKSVAGETELARVMRGLLEAFPLPIHEPA